MLAHQGWCQLTCKEVLTGKYRAAHAQLTIAQRNIYQIQVYVRCHCQVWAGQAEGPGRFNGAVVAGQHHCEVEGSSVTYAAVCCLDPVERRRDDRHQAGCVQHVGWLQPRQLGTCWQHQECCQASL